MKSPEKKQLFLLAIIAIGVIGSANAQRGGGRQGGVRSFDRGGGQFRNFGSAPSFNRQNNFTFNNQVRHEAFNNRPSTPAASIRQFPALGNRDVVSSPSPQRFDNNANNHPANTRWFDNRINPPRLNNTFDRPQRNINIYDNHVVNNYHYVPAYNYAPRRYVFVGAPRYSIMPRGFLTIRFGGYPYYYHSGLFFSFYSGYYEPVFAPIGIRVSVLPIGYYPFWIGPQRYYYYDGVYYRNYNNLDNEYEVVDAPMGAQVSALPKGATAVTINGEKFYEFNGTYYKEGVNSKDEVMYTVVGKYGHVNNTDENNNTSALRMGDVITALPDNCKEVTINGEQFYVSQDNTYYQPQTVNGVTSYKIVGAGSAKQ